MFIKKSKLDRLYKMIEQLNNSMTRNNLIDLAELLGDTKQMLKRNILAGISKGIGIGIGVTIITAIIIFALQNIVKLNIPVIGEYITDIVDIVERTRGK